MINDIIAMYVERSGFTGSWAVTLKGWSDYITGGVFNWGPVMAISPPMPANSRKVADLGSRFSYHSIGSNMVVATIEIEELRRIVLCYATKERLKSKRNAQ